MKKLMDGNTAVAHGARLARVQVVPAYPITPQSSIAEHLAAFINDGSLKARYVRAESEHSALSAAVGASMVGARAFTATASVGLALMNEITGVAAGCRLPIVMAVANRALCSPWSLWCDHSDSMSIRDQGWIQLYAENCQEAMDFVLIAYRVAEDPRVQLPCLVAEDGFFLSHMLDTVNVPESGDADRYLPPRPEGYAKLDPLAPVATNILTGPELFTDRKYEVARGLEHARQVLPEAFGEFSKLFGRSYDLVSQYGCEDAETVIVALGSMNGTLREVVGRLRALGGRVGLLRIVSYRPFPYEEVRSALSRAKTVIVFDRTGSLGQMGPLNQDVRSALYGTNPSPRVAGYVLGIGGKDISEDHVMEVLHHAACGKGTYAETYGETWSQVEARGQ